MPASPTHTTAPVGETIRLARVAARLSQAELGGKIGYSGSAVSRIENGRLTPDLDTLRAVCALLHIPPERVGLAQLGAADTPHLSQLRTDRTPTGSVEPDATKEDPVRRREFLTDMAAASAAVLGNATQATAPTSETSLAAGLNAALFHSGSRLPAPVGAAKVRAAVATAREDYRAARYTKLATRLPELIALAQTSRDRATGMTARERTAAALADAYSIATEWCVKVNQDALAWVTADRALTAARESGNPTAIGEAARMTAIAMRRAGHYDSALDLLTATAQNLDAGHEHPDALAVAGSLLLTGAYSAAQAGRRATALALASEAEQTAVRMRRAAIGGIFTTDFNPDQCALYRVGIHHALGDDTGALAHADALDIARLPTAERQARYCLDVARVYHTLGKPEQVYQALLAAERLAPEDVRRPSMRTLAAELLYAPGHLPGLRQFATRVGATA